MQTLLVLIGPNGVGKSTCAANLVQKLSNSIRVDSDWCRAMNPFSLTVETKKMVTENMYCLLKNGLSCPDINYVIFTYSLHGERKEMFEMVMGNLKKTHSFRLRIVILTATEEILRKRGLKDGRDAERIERGVRNTAHFYDDMKEIKVDTTHLSEDEVAEKIIQFL